MRDTMDSYFVFDGGSIEMETGMTFGGTACVQNSNINSLILKNMNESEM